MRSFDRYLVLWIVIVIGLLSGCDDLAFTKGEMEAKRNYESIKLGTPLQSVIEKLGNPMFELAWNSKEKRYEYLDASGKRVAIDLNLQLAAEVAPELRFLPRDLESPKVLVYSSGTVFGYVGVDPSNKVSVVRVAVS